jgi:hypothetical protein
MRGKLWIVLVAGLLLTFAGVALSLVSISVIPQGEGPPATALIGGGQAEGGGVTMQIGNYTIISGFPQYAQTPSNSIPVACRSSSRVVHGKSTQDVLTLSIEPIGITKCLADGQRLEADKGRLKVQLEGIGVVQTMPSDHRPGKFLPLSKVSAQVNKSTTEISTEVAALILIAAGPGLCIGALIPLLQRDRPVHQPSSGTPQAALGPGVPGDL